MELRFADKGLERLYADARFPGKYSQGVVKAYRQLVHYIAQATDERDFRNMKSLHYEKLTGGLHSMRLNDQFRLIVEIDSGTPGNAVVIRGIEDYH